MYIYMYIYIYLIMYKYMCVYLRTYICLYVFVRISPSVQVFYSGIPVQLTLAGIPRHICTLRLPPLSNEI